MRVVECDLPLAYREPEVLQSRTLVPAGQLGGAVHHSSHSKLLWMVVVICVVVFVLCWWCVLVFV